MLQHELIGWVHLIAGDCWISLEGDLRSHHLRALADWMDHYEKKA